MMTPFKLAGLLTFYVILVSSGKIKLDSAGNIVYTGEIVTMEEMAEFNERLVQKHFQPIRKKGHGINTQTATPCSGEAESQSCPSKQGYQEPCNATVPCDDTLWLNCQTNVEGVQLCLCEENTFWDPESRVPGQKTNGTCLAIARSSCSTEPPYQMCTKHAQCRQVPDAGYKSYCFCPYPIYPTYKGNSEGRCVGLLGTPCSDVDPCDWGLECTNGRCTCGNSNITESEEQKIWEYDVCVSRVGGPCTYPAGHHRECVAKAVCTTGGICECAEGFVVSPVDRTCGRPFGVRCTGLECLNGLHCLDSVGILNIRYPVQSNFTCACYQDIEKYNETLQQCQRIVGAPFSFEQGCVDNATPNELNRCTCYPPYIAEASNQACLYGGNNASCAEPNAQACQHEAHFVCDPVEHVCKCENSFRFNERLNKCVK